jgi:hypothetical protein
MHPRFNLTRGAPHKNATGITDFEANQGFPHNRGHGRLRFGTQLTIFRIVERLHG